MDVGSFSPGREALSKSPAAAHGLVGRSPASAEEGRLLLVTSLGDSREVTRPPQEDATLFPTCDDKRELVIGRGSHGYLALYRYMAEFDTVFVLALRAQRETGFAS